MSPTLLVGHLKAKDAHARDQMIAAQRNIVEHSRGNEPGFTKYCITVPQSGEPGEDTDLLMIEEYADEDARNAHNGSKPVQHLLSLAQSDSSPLAAPPVLYRFRPSISFTRPSVDECADPCIIFASFGYQPGKTNPSLAGWTNLVSAAEANEPGTLSYSVMEDSEKSFIRTVEVYESKEFLYGTHVKSEAIAANQEQNGLWRTGERMVFHLKKVGGYLYK